MFPARSKRQKEQSRQQRKQDKEARKEVRAREKVDCTQLPAGIDPDIAHIRPGPQPKLEE